MSDIKRKILKYINGKLDIYFGLRGECKAYEGEFTREDLLQMYRVCDSPYDNDFCLCISYKFNKCRANPEGEEITVKVSVREFYLKGDFNQVRKHIETRVLRAMIAQLGARKERLDKRNSNPIIISEKIK